MQKDRLSSSTGMEPANLQRSHNGESRVHEIVDKFRAVKVLHPSVSLLCKSPEDQEIFRASLKHDLKIIRGRSPRLLDHEISIVQKAFMIMMNNHEDRIGGIELYVQEIIGLNGVDPAQRLQSLQTAVKARDLIFHRLSDNDQIQPEQTPERSVFPMSEDAAGHYFSQTRSHAEEELFLSPVSATEPKTRQEATLAFESGESYFVHNRDTGSPPKAFSYGSDPKFNRLWDLFEDARKEFNLERSDNFRRTTAAKFLRDTIENAVSYIQSNRRATEASSRGFPYNGSNELSERLLLLRSTLRQAVEAAEKGCGGRKRRFDYSSTEGPLNIPRRSPHPQSRGTEGPYKVRQPVSSNVRDSNRHYQPQVSPYPHYHRGQGSPPGMKPSHSSHLRPSPRGYNPSPGQPRGGQCSVPDRYGPSPK